MSVFLWGTSGLNNTLVGRAMTAFSAMNGIEDSEDAAPIIVEQSPMATFIYYFYVIVSPLLTLAFLFASYILSIIEIRDNSDDLPGYDKGIYIYVIVSYSMIICCLPCAIFAIIAKGLGKKE
jgi:uncharacterized BrkB/YihY/UPF0761 family membrane protein